jgi:DNA-binding transcriptional MocR family regulator
MTCGPSPTVDANGLCPPETVDEAPRLIFVTPSHQYPLGAVMSLERRQRLLALAHQHGSWIVEDDYDSEFRFSGQPIPALQGLVPTRRWSISAPSVKRSIPGCGWAMSCCRVRWSAI